MSFRMKEDHIENECSGRGWNAAVVGLKRVCYVACTRVSIAWFSMGFCIICAQVDLEDIELEEELHQRMQGEVTFP